MANEEKISVKLIATDMDGTLLDGEGVLNPDFFSLFQQMQAHNIVFVAASGRQYYNLLKLFDSIKDEILFIAENGTYVVYRSQELLTVDIPVEQAREVIRSVRNIEGCYPVLCGKKQAYIEDELPDFVAQARTYYERCESVPDLLEVTEDLFFKIAVYDFKGSSVNCYPVLEHFNESLKVVVSGRNWLDVSNQQANKGNALKFIQEKLSISEEECMAFGDQMNDAEMLQAVRYSYAMENAPDELKNFSRYIAPANHENGVLSVINGILNKKNRDNRC